MTALLIVGIVCGVTGWAIASHAGRPVRGAVIGALMGPLGVLVVAVMTWWLIRRERRLTEAEYALGIRAEDDS